MKSFLELMNMELQGILHHSRYNSLEDFINSDDKSQDFISTLLGEDFLASNIDKSIYTVAETRARHSAITFLMGLVFWKFGDLGNRISMLNNMNSAKEAYSLWLLTALNHDRAYFSEYLKRSDVNYRGITKYYLFDDSILDFSEYENNNRDVLKYSYDDILQYDEWARQFHKNKDEEEKVDHGILGGIITFDSFIRRTLNEKQNSRYIIKSASLSIAQHNLFKSNKKKDDYAGGVRKPDVLCHDSKSIIDFDTPLLLLLSLVDTIECVKRFSKKHSKTGKFVQTLTLLKNIYLDIDKTKIIIDYSKCYDHIVKADYMFDDTFLNYTGAVCGLRKWTCLKTKKKNNLYYITLTEL